MPAPPDTPSDHASKTDDLVGRVLDDRYQIMRLLAEGGMAKIYVGKHTTLGREVAIKVLKPSFAADPDVVQRFINEGRAAGMLGHRNIVECSDLGKTPDGKPYLVLELLRGCSIADELHRRGPFAPQRTARIALRIADALATAHAAGIVPRDLKTDNVFLARKKGSAEEVKVLDFGVSKFAADRASTQKGALLGTPDFMSPEQIVDPSAVDERTDIYAVGVILYEMLSGRRPFEGVKFPLVLHHIAEETPPPLAALSPGVPSGFVAVIERAMAKQAEDRYPTMIALAEALSPFAMLPFGDADGFEALVQRPTSSVRRVGAELAATLIAPPQPVLIASHHTPLPPTEPAPTPLFAAPEIGSLAAPREDDAGPSEESDSPSPDSTPPASSRRISAAPASSRRDSAPPASSPRDSIAPTSPRRDSAAPESSRVSSPPASGRSSVEPPSGPISGRTSGSDWMDPGRTSLSPPRPQTVSRSPPRRGLLSTLGSVLVVGAVILGAYLAARSLVAEPHDVRIASSAAPALTVLVQIRPATATVTVDGEPARVVNGHVTLEGAPGSTRAVRITADGQEARADVVLGLNGAHPSELEIPPAKTEPTITASTTTAPHPTAPAIVPTSRPTTTAPVLRDDR